MVVDTSAALAIVFGESERVIFIRELYAAPVVAMSYVSWFELSIVLLRRTQQSSTLLQEDLLREFRIQLVAVDGAQTSLAMEAYRRFGKGRHPAALNFGDCFSYALAKHRNEPLLFKGDDFGQTDVLVA